MLVLFVRAIVLYVLVYTVIRLMGKRQISELQPFDLVITLLIADLASEPAADTGTPLLYGVVPILALFIVYQLMAFLSMKSNRFREIVCGHPVVIIAHGVVQEEAMRDSHYTISDLIAHLRQKDVFEPEEVAYAILETNGSLSVLLKSDYQQPTCSSLNIDGGADKPPHLLVLDGNVDEAALKESGCKRTELDKAIKRMGFSSTKELFFVSRDCNGIMHAQSKAKYGSKTAASGGKKQ